MIGELMPSRDPACVGCKYYSATNTCDYLLITGHARQLICKPGKLCTVKELGPPAQRCGRAWRGTHGDTDIIYPEELLIKEFVHMDKPKKEKHKYVRLDYDLVQNLYNDGATDAEIARLVGCGLSTIQHWRHRNKLPQNQSAADAPAPEPAPEDAETEGAAIVSGEGLTVGRLLEVLHNLDATARVRVSLLGAVTGVEAKVRYGAAGSETATVYITTEADAG